MNPTAKLFSILIISSFCTYLNAELVAPQADANADQLVQLKQELEISKKMLEEFCSNPTALKSPLKRSLIKASKEIGYLTTTTIVTMCILCTWMHLEKSEGLSFEVFKRIFPRLIGITLIPVSVYALLKFMIESPSISEQELQDNVKEFLNI